MFYRLLADAVALLHFSFILFVVLGGLLVIRYPRLIWLHLPAAAWGVLIEFYSWGCPLTPLENYFRLLAGETPYAGGFIERYLIPLIYPADLRYADGLLLGTGCLLLNGLIYLRMLKKYRARKKHD